MKINGINRPRTFSKMCIFKVRIELTKSDAIRCKTLRGMQVIREKKGQLVLNILMDIKFNMIYDIKYGFVFLALLFFNCSTSIEKENIQIQPSEAIIENVTNQLNSFNFDCVLKGSEEDGIFSLEVLFRGDTIFLDQFSNELLLKTLVYGEFNALGNYERVNMRFVFENFGESVDFNLGKPEMQLIETFFNERKGFYEEVVHSFRSFSYQEVVAFDSIIKLFIRNREKIVHASNYWELLQNFTFFCNGNDEFIDEARGFIALIQLIKHEQLEIVSSDVYKKFEGILKRNKIELEVLDMEKSQVAEYLKSL